MSMLRPYILPLAVCLAIEAGIYYGLVSLGAREDVIVSLEMIWLCVAVLVTLTVGGHFGRKGDER
jgi:hypothetical protein